MTSLEVTELLAFLSTEPPLGEARADLRVAHQTALLLNAVKGKKGQAVKVKDTMLQFKDQKKQGSGISDPQAQLEFLKAFTLAAGGTVED